MAIRSLQWRHDKRDSVSNYQLHDCLYNRLFRRRWKKSLQLCVTGLCEGNSPVTGEFPAQRINYAENVSIWWRHHGYMYFNGPPISHLQCSLALMTLAYDAQVYVCEVIHICILPHIIINSAGLLLGVRKTNYKTLLDDTALNISAPLRQTSLHGFLHSMDHWLTLWVCVYRSTVSDYTELGAKQSHGHWCRGGYQSTVRLMHYMGISVNMECFMQTRKILRTFPLPSIWI